MAEGRLMRVPGIKILAAAALALLCFLQALALLRTPPAWLPASIEVSLAPGAALLLGRDELAAPQAGGRHLRLRRNAAGAWYAASADGVQGLRFERGTQRFKSGARTVEAGLQIQLGVAHYRFSSVNEGVVAFSDGTHAWHYDGASVRRDGQALGACPGTGPGARLLGLWNRMAPRALTLARPLRFGGNLSCGIQVGNAGAAPGSAQLAFEDGVPFLYAAAGLERVPLLVMDKGMPRDLALAEQALTGVTAIVVGRTRLLARVDQGRLHLRPAQRVSLFHEARTELPEGVRWHWERRAPWTWPAAGWWTLAAAAGTGLLAAALAGRTRWRADVPAAARLGAGIALAVAGFGLLLAQRAGNAPGVGPALLLSWTALWYAFTGRRTGAVMTLGVLLLAAGLLLQLELGTGAPDTSWLRHFQKTAAASTLGLGLLGVAGQFRGAKAPGQARVELLLLLLAGAALGALLLQVGWGNETGVFDLQPVEFAKLALTVLTAHCLALGLGGGATRGSALLRWLRLASPALVFMLLLAVALVQVDDYSPLILLLVWGAAMLLAWSCAARKPGPALAVAALVGTCLLGLAVLRGAAPGEVAQWSFYGERFGVWLDPAAHPHTGQQLLLGAGAIASGGWFGADGLFGLAAIGHGALEALAIPAVQDDFAPSFLLQRHGLASGLILWVLQALFLCALLHSAWRAWQGGSSARDYRQAWLGRFRCFVLCGGAAFLFGHFLLSWGTNLAFFPIMGQPMSFLSAGGSHLLFFIFPLLAFHAAGAPSIEENSSCRSTSNTKP
ncbi:FtsW/RodA/SpoVE family cell cycle protein [Massilia sp. CMS3.1]|uniref:FtsW/RodA/SpoVE family cell cycle protein n=1 Tax=Massilia sp. CMS3.1 TaxID=3373083 RepID=UPI003EE6B9AA